MKQKISTAAWDAEFNSDVCDAFNNADLTIKLRLGFKQINPAAGAASGIYHDYGDPTEQPRKIIKWSNQAWNAWKSNFLQSAQRYWHGKFWLVNNFDQFTYEVDSVKFRPNVWCRFELSEVDPAIGTPHHSIDVVRLHNSESWFGSHSTLYDSLDTRRAQKSTDSLGNGIMQQAHVHEIGHLLGLGHVDIGKAHCPAGGNTNATACYGVSDADKRSVMGAGMKLLADHATPWRRAIIQISGKGNIASPGDWAAKMQRHYPRTDAEAKANKAILSRLSRKPA